MRIPPVLLFSVATTATASAQPLVTSRSDYHTTPAPRAIVVADFNRDGWPDVAVAGTVTNSVSVLLNRGPGASGFRPAADIAVGGGPFEMVAGDANGDGFPDLAIANADLDAVTLLFGRGDGTFLPKRDIAVPGNPRGIALADVNRDGKLDVLVTQYALTVNLEECIGCGLGGWGWEDDGWGAKDLNGVLLRFPRGAGVIVIQTREDGISIDQIVLSAVKYLTTRPGAAKGDHTILPSTISH